MKKGFVFAIFLVFLFGAPCQAKKEKMYDLNHLSNGRINVFIEAGKDPNTFNRIDVPSFHNKLCYKLRKLGFETKFEINDEEFMSKPYVTVFLFSPKLIEGNYEDVEITWHLAESKFFRNSGEITYRSPKDLLEKIVFNIQQWDRAAKK